jgi:hypothetical protein
MFSCCCRKRTNPVKTSRILPIATSPPFTLDEIEIIKQNLTNICDFNFYTYTNQTTMILEVYSKLYSATKPSNPPDSKKDPWANILVGALEIVGIVTEQPEIEILAVVVGGVVEYVTSENDTVKTITGYDLAKDFSSEIDRNQNTYESTQKILSTMYSDPNTYRDQVLSIPGYKSCTLRDLINVDIPNKAAIGFTNAVAVQSRAFRANITVEEMAKLQNWDIYFVNDVICSQEGHVYHPATPGIIGGVQRSRLFNSDNVGNGVRVVANDEIRTNHPEYVHAQGFGTSNSDLVKSYVDANNSFINQFPAALIYPWTVTNISVYSCRWYIMEGLDKIPDDSLNTPVANGDFMKWLFIDDGFGNIVNGDGIMYRYDFVMSGVMTNGQFIPGSNMFPAVETMQFTSSDDKYRYPGKNTNKKVKIYTGDILKRE